MIQIDREKEPAAKRFQRLGLVSRTLISLAFAALLFAMLYGWIQLVRSEKIWCLLIFFVVPAIQFLATPIFTQLGFYHYYSPMVVSFGKNERYIDLHNGTSFDYLFEMFGVRPGIHWKKRWFATISRPFAISLSAFKRESFRILSQFAEAPISSVRERPPSSDSRSVRLRC